MHYGLARGDSSVGLVNGYQAELIMCSLDGGMGQKCGNHWTNRRRHSKKSDTISGKLKRSFARICWCVTVYWGAKPFRLTATYTPFLWRSPHELCLTHIALPHCHWHCWIQNGFGTKSEPPSIQYLITKETLLNRCLHIHNVNGNELHNWELEVEVNCTFNIEYD